MEDVTVMLFESLYVGSTIRLDRESMSEQFEYRGDNIWRWNILYIHLDSHLAGCPSKQLLRYCLPKAGCRICHVR